MWRTVERARARRIERVVARVVAVVVGAALLLLVAGLTLLQTRWAGQHLADLLAARATAAVAGKVDVRSLDIDGTTVVLTGITVRDPRGVCVGSVRKVRAQLALPALLHKRLALTELRVSGVYARFERGQTRAGLRAALTPTHPSSGGLLQSFGLELRQGRLEQAVIEVHGPPGTPPLRVHDLMAELHGHLLRPGGRFQAEFELHGRGEPPLGGAVAASGALEGALDRSDGLAPLQAGHLNARMGEQLALEARVPSPGTIAVKPVHLSLTPALGRALLPRWPVAATVDATGWAEMRTAAVGFTIDARLAQGGGSAHAAGSLGYHLQRSPGGLTVRLDDVDPAMVLGGGPSAAVDLSLSVAAGPLRPGQLTATARLQAEAARWKGLRFGPLALAAAVDQGRIRQLAGTTRVPGARLTLGRGPAPEAATVWGQLTITNLDTVDRALGRLGLGPLSLAGRAQVRFALRGQPAEGLGALGLMVEARLPRLAHGSWRARDLALRLELPAREEDRPDAAPRRFELAASAAEPLKLALSASGARVPKAQAEGAPLALLVDRLALTHPSSQGPQRWQLCQPPARLAVGSTVRLDSFDLCSGQQRIALSATLGEQAIRAQLSLAAVHLSRLPAPLAQPLPGGTLAGHLRLHGTRTRPVVSADLRLQRGRWHGISGIAVMLEGTYREGRARGTLAANAEDLDLSADLDLPVPRDVPAHAALHADLKITRAQLAESSLGPRRLGARAQFSAVAHLHGTAGAPLLTASATLGTLQVTGAPGTQVLFSGTGGLALDYADRQLTADLHLAQGGSRPGTLRARGTMQVPLSWSTLSSGPALQLTQRPIEAELDMRNFSAPWLAQLLQPLRLVRGELASDVHIEGTVAKPQVRGSLTWRHGRIIIVPRHRPK
jgi:hypothetical protein